MCLFLVAWLTYGLNSNLLGQGLHVNTKKLIHMGEQNSNEPRNPKQKSRHSNS